MILVDTSIWIDHLRAGEPALADALQGNEVLMHPLVVGELACGNLGRRRAEILRMLAYLPPAPVASDAEVLAFIEANALMARGIGYADAHLLAATALTGSAALWTRDRRLAAVAKDVGLALP